uniref:CSON006061 protein n=1 Tax=Culicoides sonorensis TaxID=179676 RepID=A0A336MRS0_CULSO
MEKNSCCGTKKLETTCIVLGVLSILVRVVYFVVIKAFMLMMIVAFAGSDLLALVALGLILPDVLVFIFDIVLIVGISMKSIRALQKYFISLIVICTLTALIHTFIAVFMEYIGFLLIELIIIGVDTICCIFVYKTIKKWKGQESEDLPTVSPKAVFHKNVPSTNENLNDSNIYYNKF